MTHSALQTDGWVAQGYFSNRVTAQNEARRCRMHSWETRIERNAHGWVLWVRYKVAETCKAHT